VLKSTAEFKAGAASEINFSYDGQSIRKASSKRI
jgi:hypothetical protein